MAKIPDPTHRQKCSRLKAGLSTKFSGYLLICFRKTGKQFNGANRVSNVPLSLCAPIMKGVRRRVTEGNCKCWTPPTGGRLVFYYIVLCMTQQLSLVFTEIGSFRPWPAWKWHMWRKGVSPECERRGFQCPIHTQPDSRVKLSWVQSKTNKRADITSQEKIIVLKKL